MKDIIQSKYNKPFTNISKILYANDYDNANIRLQK